MYIELFVVAGQNAELENALKKVVEDLRKKVQRGDKVRLATVKIRPDAVDQVLRLVGEAPEKVPPHYRSLVNMLKKYSISKFPAVVVDGVKVGEGDIDVDRATNIIYERAKSEFPELAAAELVPPAPTPAPVQPVIKELEMKPPEAPRVELPRAEPRPVEPLPPPPEPPPPPPPVVERPPPPSVTEAPKPVSPPALPPAEPPRPVSPPAPPKVEVPRVEARPPPRAVETPRVTAVVKLVLGRPDNCAECAYFGPLTSRCFLFGFAVADPAAPPCKQYARGRG